MWKKIVIGVMVLLLVIFPLIVAMQPSQFKISRFAVIDASPAEVFAHVNDFHKWEDWSPWAKLDPNSTATFEGKDSGEGAVFKWSGNDEVGVGTMTIIESKPTDRIKIRLDFEKPMQDTSEAEFTFVPEGDKTKVTWSMYGDQSFMEKAVCLFMNLDKMVGEKFEEGLENMKAVVEKEPAGGK